MSDHIGVHGTAVISADTLYRYNLTRDLPPVLQSASSYKCSACDQRITDHAQMEEYQHSECGGLVVRHTYLVPRPLVICGLNPSTADARVNDPTIRREIGFAQSWGCERLVKVNAYAYRSTDPKKMFKAAKAGIDIIGPDNDDHIRAAAMVCRLAHGIFLVAWGVNAPLDRARWINEIITTMEGVQPMCLATNNDGSPRHPLYEPKDAQPIPWSIEGRKP